MHNMTSCETQLLEFLEDITKSIDNGEEGDVVYLDFCKSLRQSSASLAFAEALRLRNSGKS